MKPNVVAPGTTVTSARAGTTSDYSDRRPAAAWPPRTSPGSRPRSWSTTPSFEVNPALLRAHLMATAIAHDDVTRKSNDYGLGRVSGYVAHWAQPNADGWSTYWFWGTRELARASSTGDITVPAGTQRLVVVLTWDEPPASAGASRAVTYDLDLWVDHMADCSEPPKGACGEYSVRLQHRQRRVRRRQQSARRAPTG